MFSKDSQNGQQVYGGGGEGDANYLRNANQPNDEVYHFIPVRVAKMIILKIQQPDTGGH